MIALKKNLIKNNIIMMKYGDACCGRRLYDIIPDVKTRTDEKDL
jgi:hypothetical protein